MSLTRGQLPVRLTPLVGRESELDDIVQALHHHRLVTLTGPGGAGKTRLALAAARTAEASFPAGTCWAALAQIDDPAIVGQAVATQLGVPDTPGQDPVEAIAKEVADHRVLVVLDNCEHLAEAAAGLAVSDAVRLFEQRARLRRGARPAGRDVADRGRRLAPGLRASPLTRGASPGSGCRGRRGGSAVRSA